MNARAWLLSAALLCACLDDEDDGKPSPITRVMLDAAVADASGDGSTMQPALTLSCPAAVVSERTLAGFSVRMRDASGGVPGAFVALSPSTGIVVAPEAGGGTTDANGEVAFAFSAPHFDADTPITLEASTRGADGKVIASARCNFQIVSAALVFSDADLTVEHARPTRVALRVQAADVEPLCSDGGGLTVRFASNRGGGFSTSETAAPGPTLCVDLTDGGTRASFWAHSGDAGGSASIEATAKDYREALDVTLIGAPASVALLSDSTDLDVSSAANLTAKVVDDVGQPVAGVRVEFALARCAVTPCGEGETVTPASSITQRDGSARFVYFAGASPGAAQVTAQVTDRPGVLAAIVLRVK